MRTYLKELRNDNSITQSELAEALGIRQGYYSSIENGSRQNVIDLLLLVKIAEYFSVPVLSLIEQELAIVNSKGV